MNDVTDLPGLMVSSLAPSYLQVNASLIVSHYYPVQLLKRSKQFHTSPVHALSVTMLGDTGLWLLLHF